MAVVSKVDLKLQVNINETVKYQILTYCFFENILISNSDLKCLMELSKQPKVELTKFCIFLTEQGIFKSSQSARNALAKSEKKKLIIKSGVNKKTISINEDMNVQVNGLVYLDYKILGRES